MVNGHQVLNGPQAPTPNFCHVDRPDVVWIPGRNGAGFGRLLLLLSWNSWSYRCISRSRSLQNVPDDRGKQENAQQPELVGDSSQAPTEVGPGDLTYQRGDVAWRLVRRSNSRSTILDLVEPATQGGSSDDEVPLTFRLGI